MKQKKTDKKILCFVGTTEEEAFNCAIAGSANGISSIDSYQVISEAEARDLKFKNIDEAIRSILMGNSISWALGAAS